MSDLIYPTLDLFLYGLKAPLNVTSEEIKKNEEDFLSQLNLPYGTQINEFDGEIEYLELTNPAQVDLKLNDKTLEGFYYPVRLNDTYGLQIDCSINNQTKPQLDKCFKNLKAEIEAEIETRFSKRLIRIGETWLLSSSLPEGSSQKHEDLVKDCYRALFGDEDYQLQGKGTFLGGNIFELGSSVHNHSKINTPHVIIAIYPNQESAKEAAEFYSDWMGLFCYRSKIAWAYEQSLQVKESLINRYKKIEANRNIINQSNYGSKKQKFSISQKILNNDKDILQQYPIDLLNLSFQKHIIEINLSDYQTRMTLIKEKAGQDNQLDFLENFSDLANKKYLPQIAKDIDNMQLGLKLLEHTVNSFRNHIEVEKAERDRRFKELVAVAGAGIATVSLFKDPAKDFCSKDNSKDIFPKIPHFCDYPFSFVFIFGLFIGFVVWILRKRLLK